MQQVASLSSAAFDAFSARRRFGSIDGLRAASVIAVIWHHVQRGDSTLLAGATRGFLGVDLFFVISGFLIVTLLLRERSATGEISLANFYARRTLRIFPPYYALLAMLSILYAVRESPRADQFFSELPFYVTYTSNWTAPGLLPWTWSLASEEQFYLLWPPIERWLRRAALPLMGLLVLASQAVNFDVFSLPRSDLMILQTTFTPICFGVLLAHVLHRRSWFGYAYAVLGRAHALPVALLAVAVVVNIPNDDISGVHRLALQLSMAAVVGAAALRDPVAQATWLDAAAVARVGAVSYGMYLYHAFAVDGIHAFSPTLPTWATFVVSVMLSYAVAEGSYRVLESPLLRLKRRFAAS